MVEWGLFRSWFWSGFGSCFRSRIVKVISVDICPYQSVVATGAEDGVVRIWRYNDPLGIGMSIEEANRNCGVILQEQHQNVTEKVSRQPIHTLQSHVAPVTDVYFSHKGDRILSGSMLADTVCIWGFSPNLATHDHIELSVSECTGTSGGSEMCHHWWRCWRCIS